MTEYKATLKEFNACLADKEDGSGYLWDAMKGPKAETIRKALLIAHTIEAQALKPMPLEPDDELLKAGFMYKKVTEGASQIVPITLDQYKRLLNHYDFKPEEM